MKGGEMLLTSEQIKIVLRHEVLGLSRLLSDCARGDHTNASLQLSADALRAFDDRLREIKRLYALIEPFK